MRSPPHLLLPSLMVTLLALLGPSAGAVTVTVGLSISDVHYDMKVNSDERRQVTDTALVTGWLRTEWTDASLARSGGGQTSRRLSSTAEMWLPDIRHLNTIESASPSLLTNSSDGIVDASGKVHFETPVRFAVRFIPKDFNRSFEIRLGSRLMTTAEMNLQPADDTLDVSEYTGWYLTNTWMWKNETTRAGFTEPFSLLVAGVFPTVI
ncbi:Acetylcholine receptor subunit alpha-type acr-16 [Amphibalanus amphitrite]|uniref:Acetylcholine receptor subunit alpha-type acr-16 n=1 Tax=Amphibalanus amphitrite TaxID=1232801 RepID=A0A6A4W3X0_AMPAM|nr:acetylcholine receptor subunit alpha-type acr-16-like [Amphibalanus amphitrite]XP_043225000.1 acetylcholine receptor subunit alpha-type acr-16-like [Amphibalanus amphitrite]KAF0297682.1 Acetylcholine receptor subunit alpha-type acr-16 [Amphibalanus amphitrite]